MGILYFASVICLFTAFMLIKKTDKELNVICFASITIVLLFCYNAFVCYVMTFFSIPITLLSLSITNVVIAIIMALVIMLKKERQKYNFNKTDLICVFIILVITVAVACSNYGIPFNIKYETGDPAVHYLTSVLFANQDSLLNLYDDVVHDSFQTRKIGSYVNSGIIMKCFSNIIDEIDYYNIFIAFSIFILFMTGVMMYVTLEKFTKSTKGKILALIVSLIYVLGYPLNSMLFGFEYLSLGILVLGTVINMIYYFEEKELKFGYYLVIFALLNFNIFCSYYMFVPFMYSGLWIYFCIYSKKHNKKIICKKNIALLSVTLLIPFFLGYIYHLAPGIYNIFNLDAWEALMQSLQYSSGILNHSFALYGYIYINFYSNMILLIPLAIYYIVRKTKEGKIFSFDIITLVILLIFIGILKIGQIYEKVSVYFIMKNYYALWLFLIYMNFRALMYIFEKNRVKTYCILMFYMLLVILNLIFIDAPLENQKENPNESIKNVSEIFGVNKTMITEKKKDLTVKDIEILKIARDRLDFKNEEIEVLGDSEQLYWTYSLLRYVNAEYYFEYPQYSGQQKLTIKATKAHEKIGKVDYMIYFKSSKYYDMNKVALFDQGEVIYENEAGGIVKFDKEK